MDDLKQRAAPAWTAAQQRVMAALGMPVWLRRNQPLPPSAGAEAQTTTGSVPAAAAAGEPVSPAGRSVARAAARSHAAPAPGPATASRPAATAVPQFDLAYAHLGSVVLVADRLADGVAHLARDLALVVGSRARAPQPVSLQWPGSVAGPLAADRRAAAQAAHGLLDRLLGETPPKLVVVLGPAAVSYLISTADGDRGEFERDAVTWVWHRGARTSGAAKQVLWSLLQPHLEGLRA